MDYTEYSEGHTDVLSVAQGPTKNSSNTPCSRHSLGAVCDFLFIGNSPGEQSHIVGDKPGLRPKESVYCFLSQ